MSERQTGATPEQVEAAAKRADDSWGYGEGMPHILGAEVRTAAPFLVLPDERIVKAEDLRVVLECIPDEPKGLELRAAAARLREVLG